MLTTVITFIIVLGFLVFIHELGHFMAARKVGVKVLEFSIGFPPKLISKTVGDTKYMLSWIPLGGYVRLKGQDTEDEDPNEAGNYASKTILQRFFILIAGPFMNILTAFIFMPLVFMIGYEVPAYLDSKPVIYNVTKDSLAEKLDIKKDDQIISINGVATENWKKVQKQINDGSQKIEIKILRSGNEISKVITPDLLETNNAIGWEALIEPVIGKVVQNSSAYKAGLEKGDRILNINGDKINSWTELSPHIQVSKGKALNLLINRNGDFKEIEIIPTWNKQNNYWVIGVLSLNINHSEGFVDAITLGSKRVVFLAGKSFEFLYRLVSGKESVKAVGGPIMIASMIGDAAKSGVSNLLALVAFISLQLGIFNLLPIPALDGGHILFLLFEKIKGQTLSKKFRINMQKTGFSILLMLILYISVQDGIRIFN